MNVTTQEKLLHLFTIFFGSIIFGTAIGSYFNPVDKAGWSVDKTASHIGTFIGFIFFVIFEFRNILYLLNRALIWFGFRKEAFEDRYKSISDRRYQLVKESKAINSAVQGCNLAMGDLCKENEQEYHRLVKEENEKASGMMNK